MTDDIVKLDGRVVYENRWLRVREDRVRRRDGSEGVYGLVDKPDFAAVAALDDGALHLVEQFRYPVGARCWELPQGGVEGGEDLAPELVARRELEEEAGVVAATMTWAGRLLMAPGFSGQKFDVFLATDLSPGVAAREITEQDMIARPIPIPEINAMILDGRIQDSTTVAALGLLRMRGML